MLSALLSSPLQAQTNCSEVIRTCDQAIEKRNELIQLQADRINQIQDENDRLSTAVLTLKTETDRASQTQWLYGAGGVLLGIIIGAMVIK